MLTYRKALILAAFFFTTIYLIQSSHSKSNRYEADTLEDVGSKGDKTTAMQATELPTGKASQPTRAYPPPKYPKNQDITQQPMNNMAGKSLKDRLRYQFPYDPDGTFPAYIWQTWKATPDSGDFGDDFRPMEASWTELHPGFIHEVITDQTAVHLIRYLYASVPEVQEAYNALPLPVLKADFFRYLILLARGGIYSDIDTQALKTAVDWLPKDVSPSSIGLIVGIEADPDRPDWKDWYSRRIQFCQWTIQAKAGHPVLRSIVAAITEDTLRMKKLGILSKKRLDKTIVEFTGPALWTDIIFAYFNSPEYFNVDQNGKNITFENFTGMETAKKVGDVVVLPITSFSPGVQQMGAKDLDDPMAFVKHEFEGKNQFYLESGVRNSALTNACLGTWKAAWERVKPIYETPPSQDKDEPNDQPKRKTKEER